MCFRTKYVCPHCEYRCKHYNDMTKHFMDCEEKKKKYERVRGICSNCMYRLDSYFHVKFCQM